MAHRNRSFTRRKDLRISYAPSSSLSQAWPVLMRRAERRSRAERPVPSRSEEDTLAGAAVRPNRRGLKHLGSRAGQGRTSQYLGVDERDRRGWLIGLQKNISSPVSPPPISTDVASSKYSLEDATPRAQTRQEVEALEQEGTRRQRSSHLEGTLAQLPPSWCHADRTSRYPRRTGSRPQYGRRGFHRRR